MTKAGKLSIEFSEFKAEVEARLSALEGDKKPAPKKSKGIVVDAVDDKIVATEE